LCNIIYDWTPIRNPDMTNIQKDCFGILDSVFPAGRNGSREIVPHCFDCPDKKACLQAALATKEGIALRNQVLDRAAARGLVGRLKRWSEKKALSRLKEHKGEK
jgi:hypothetical protein